MVCRWRISVVLCCLRLLQSVEVNAPSFRFCKVINIRLPRLSALVAESSVRVKLCFESDSGKKTVLGSASFSGRSLIAAAMEASDSDAAAAPDTGAGRSEGRGDGDAGNGTADAAPTHHGMCMCNTPVQLCAVFQ